MSENVGINFIILYNSCMLVKMFKENESDFTMGPGGWLTCRIVRILILGSGRSEST